jgi:hypothetical protein
MSLIGSVDPDVTDNWVALLAGIPSDTAPGFKQ